MCLKVVKKYGLVIWITMDTVYPWCMNALCAFTWGIEKRQCSMPLIQSPPGLHYDMSRLREFPISTGYSTTLRPAWATDIQRIHSADMEDVCM